ncbi:hypothetical protein [Sporosalibacterium faouarense]|uniref:hypothetical protein n=1 Tax=Sporosalibacterium faouarense TaxID=516123 RepID=UPI00141CD057|nr:hypothetical protein [Sporosalibacterium faouarense]MTI48860.1 hypothetical protein [Bacillota bacterium]
MKKTKFLALALAVAVMLMGAGYAAWSNQTFLTTTVRTGNFKMEITDTSIRTGDRQEANEAHDWHEYDWTHGGNVDHNATSAVVEFNDLYPGGTVQVDMTTTNNGTIPAKLKSAKVEYLSGNEDLFNLLLGQTSWKADINGDGSKDDWDHVEWNRENWRGLQGALNALVANINDHNAVIEPGGWLSLGDGEENGCIKIKLDPDAGNEFQNKNVKFKITFNWEQWTTDPTENPYDGDNGYGGDGDVQ